MDKRIDKLKELVVLLKQPAVQSQNVSSSSQQQEQPVKEQEKPVKNGLCGDLEKINESNLQNGLQGIAEKGLVKFSEIKTLFQKLKTASEPIDSYEKAIIYLFKDQKGDVPEKSVQNAKNRIADKEKKEKEAQEIERKQKSFAKNYPGGTIGYYYRGDGRPEKDIKAKGGFTAYKTLSIEEAREMVKLWFGKDGSGPIASHQDWISNKSGGDKIATGNDIGCMGYGCTGIDGAIRNVYQIIVPGLKEVALTEENLGFELHSDVTTGKSPSLIMNSNKLSTATVIAVGGARAEETTFFTTLEMKWVKLVYEKTPDDKDATPRGWVTPL